ncbi:MAG: energy transducer TonB [Reichenbachiella sp.]
MKKRALIFSVILTAIGLTSFSFLSWNPPVSDPAETSSSTIDGFELEKSKVNKSNPNFFYALGSKYITTITKEKLHRARSIVDIIPIGSAEGIESYRDIKIVMLIDGKEQFEKGSSYAFNWEQLAFLQSVNYSTNFYIEGFYKRKNATTGNSYEQHFTYYITTVPEKEAAFKGGQLELLDYLKENSSVATAFVTKEQLESGKVHFTVSQSGEISNVKLASTSGYSAVDKTMIDLITKMPGNWEPAENAKGEKVDQELVFSFGMIGC